MVVGLFKPIVFVNLLGIYVSCNDQFNFQTYMLEKEIMFSTYARIIEDSGS